MDPNLLYIALGSLNKYDGISKKIKGQVQALKDLGINTSISYLSTDQNNKFNGRIINDRLAEEFKPTLGIRGSWKWRYKFKTLTKYIKENDINVVYIRYSHYANPFFIKFLKRLKKEGVFIFLEIPTFPYDAEYNHPSLPVKFNKYIEEHYRNYFSKYVDRVVTFSDAGTIFNTKTVKINNGIELDKINLKKKLQNSHSIHLIAVATMFFWHGYDRLIEGLQTYYHNNSTPPVYLHLVGDSDNEESKKYKALVTQYNLQDYVQFHGYKTGKELDKIFDKANLAIGCLGVHRKKIDSLKSLKNAEYCARGIPFVYSESDNTFDKQPFTLKMPPDDSPIDIYELVNFVKTNQFSPHGIRNFAEANLTWKIQMKKIQNLIKIFPFQEQQT